MCRLSIYDFPLLIQEPSPPLPPTFLMLNPGKASSLELLLRTMYLLRIHHKITFKSECKVGHPNIMTSVPLPHPSTPYFLMPSPGEVASLGLLLRTMYLSRIHQKTLYGSECKVCCHGCRTRTFMILLTRGDVKILMSKDLRGTIHR